MVPVYSGTELSANMVVLAQSRRDGGEMIGVQTGSELRETSVSGENPRSLLLPLCVPRDESAAITVCMHAVAAGEYTGVEFAELLQRAEIRCEVAHNVEGLGITAGAGTAVYLSAVASVDKSFGWLSNFVSDVAEMAVVMGVTSRVSGLARVDELDAAVRSALNLRVIGQNVAVATPAADRAEGEVKTLHDDYRVVPISMYRSLMKVGAKVVGSAVCVSVSRSTDGVYRLENEFDCSSCYSIASLPLGRYSLPGGFGRLVSGRFLRGVLESVIAIPALKSTDGFCYIDTLPPSMRLKAASVLGRNPSVMNICSVFPETYDWSSVEATVKQTGYSGDCPNYHVVKAGAMPVVLPRTARLGMADRHASELSMHTDKLLNDIFSSAVAPAAGIEAPGLQQRLRQPDRTLHAAQVDRGGAGVVDRTSVPRVMVPDSSASLSPYETRLMPSVRGPTRHIRSVSDSGLTLSNRVVLDMGANVALRPVWEDVDNPRARMWITRLGEGAPIDPKRLLELAKVKSADALPVPPSSVSGTSVMVRPGNFLRSEGGKLVSWDSRMVVVPGCHMECSKLASSKGRRFVAVHPARGVICRYDISFERSVVVNGSLNVNSSDCVLWLHSDVSFDIIGAGSVVRTWFDDGMPGLGAMVTSMVFSFGSSAIRRYGGEIQAERVIGLELKSVDPGAGLVRFHKKFRMKPNLEKIHLYAFDEVVAEPVLLVVQAPGLRYVVVHGVKIPANECQASVVVLDAQTTVKVCVDAASESTAVDAQMIFVRESQRYASCVGHNVTGTGFTTAGKSAGLFIESK